MTTCAPINDKLMSAAEAVRRFIKDGDMIALGGFTVSRNPMVIAREIIRQNKRDLHLVMHSQGQSMDLMVGAGCVRRLELAYGGTGRFAPTGIRFRKAVQSGQVQVEDYSNFHMSLRFLAGSLNLPFIPCRSGFATDVLNKQGFGPELRGQGKIPARKAIISQNPFCAEPDAVVLLPALMPDVALIHAQYVGDDGTVRIKGLTFLDVEQAKSASRIIVTCEEIVPAERLREDPDQNTLPPFLIDAVVQAPYGAHPTACHYFYDYDPRHLNYYRQVAGDDGSFRRYLDEWVLTPETHEAYLAKVGVSDLMNIKANTKVGYAPGLDRR
ncbi:MAG: CoA-transferase [Pseudomonadota bacterium]